MVRCWNPGLKYTRNVAEPSSPAYVTVFWLPQFLNNPLKLLTFHSVFGWKSKATVSLFKPVQLCELIVWAVTEGYV